MPEINIPYPKLTDTTDAYMFKTDWKIFEIDDDTKYAMQSATFGEEAIKAFFEIVNREKFVLDHANGQRFMEIMMDHFQNQIMTKTFKDPKDSSKTLPGHAYGYATKTGEDSTTLKWKWDDQKNPILDNSHSTRDRSKLTTDKETPYLP